MESIDIFPWDDHFNTGISTIDEQHIRLVELLNLLARAVAFKSDDLYLNQIFDELLDYTVYHFDAEETIWGKYFPNDPMEEDHKAIHQKFVDTVVRLKFEQNERSSAEIAEETLAFLARWLASHILETDRFMAYIVLSLQAGDDMESAKYHATEKMNGFTRTLIDLILSIYETLSGNTLQLMYEIKKQKQLEEQVRYQAHYQDLLLELSSSFIHLTLEAIEPAITAALKKMALFVDADRAYIFRYDFDEDTMSNTYEWCREGISPQIDELQALPIDTVPEWLNPHLRGEYILIDDVFALPEGNLRAILEPQEIKSLLTLPLMYEGQCQGFIGFDAVRKYHLFDAGEIRLLEIFATLLAHLEERKHAEEQTKELEEKLRIKEEYQRTVLNNFPFLVWLKDAQGKFLAINNVFVQVFEGFDAENIIGKTDFDIWPSDLAQAYRDDDMAVMQSGRVKNIEEEVEFNGNRRWMETYKSPVIVDGIVMGTVGFARDITERKSNEIEILEAKNLLSTIIDTMPVRIFWKDSELNYLGCNRLFAQDSGMEDPSMLIGKDDFQMGWADQAELYRADDRRVIQSGEGKLFYEEPQTTPDGNTIWLSTSKVPIKNHDGDIIGVVGSYEDITQRKELESKLRLAANVFTHSREGILITTEDGTIVDVNNAFTRITGYRADEVIGKKPSLLKSGLQGDDFYRDLWRSLVKKGHWYGEVWNCRKNGEVYAELLTISTIFQEDGKIKNYVALFSDITTIKDHEKHLQHIAHYDTLTGLANRVLLSDRLEQAMMQTSRRGSHLAVAYLDLDGFKEINDTHGHDAGDQLLMAISQNMKRSLREGDTLSRLGGDEFVAVLLDLEDFESSIPTLKRLLHAASQPVVYEDVVLEVSASLGVTFYPQQDEIEADQLLRQADQAMYQAKQAGKNRFHLFDAEQDLSVRAHNEKIEGIRYALKEQQFLLYYQPKVNMHTSEIIGVEALIRWQHPTQGILPPIYFLPIIEDHPLAIDVGEWVISTALKQIDTWQSMGHSIKISVNIGARQLQQSDFLERLHYLLGLYPNVSPAMLELEVLETSALEDIHKISRIISECKKIGIAFALDDFGTGYSSLTYLKHLPISLLKIDQSFVRDMLYDSDDLAILEGVLGLGTAFHRHVIAEGVETLEHGKMLLQLGCELAQGYAIARPMPASEFPAWTSSWKSDPEWLNCHSISREGVQFLYASVEHNAWVNSVEMFLKESYAVAPELNPNMCRFGEWLNSSQSQNLIDDASFKRIKTLHEEIHTVASLLCDLKKSGPVEQTVQGIKQLHTLRDSLNETLMGLIRD